MYADVIVLTLLQWKKNLMPAKIIFNQENEVNNYILHHFKHNLTPLRNSNKIKLET
jgi:hypothetical protein